MIFRKYKIPLALLMLLSLLLVGCGEKTPSQTSAEQHVEASATASPTETTEPEKTPESHVYVLTAQQAETFDSAVCHLFKREGQNLYALQYSNCPVIVDKGVLSPDFDDMVIELSGIGDDICHPYFDIAATSQGERAYIGNFALLGDGVSVPDHTSVDCMFLPNASGGELAMAASALQSENARERMLSGAYRELLDLSVYEQALFSVSPFYIPGYDQEGQLLPPGEWEVDSRMYTFFFDYPQELTFSYVPLIGGDYYWIYKITDKEGNVTYSDLLPYSTPEKPMEEEIPHNIHAVWEEGTREILLLEENGVDVYLAVGKNLNSESYYTLKVRNNRDANVTCTGEDVVLNGSVICDTKCSLTVMPGKFVADSAGFDTAVASSAPETENLTTIAFTFTVKDERTEEVLVEKQRATVDITRSWPLSNSYRNAYTLSLPAMDYLAGEQVLLEENAIRVTLIGAGAQYANLPDSLTTTLKVENFSSQDRTLTLKGYVVNGIFVPQTRRISVRGNSTAYVILSFSATTLEEYTNPSVETLSVVLSIPETRDWLYPSSYSYCVPVTTLEAGTAEVFDPGEPLWEEGGLSVGYRGYHAEKNRWLLTLTNRGEEAVNLHCITDSGYRITTDVYAGVGESTVFSLSDYKAVDGKLIVKFLAYRFNGETLLFEGAEHITLETK